MSLLALFPIVLPSCLILYVINYYWWVSKYPKGPRPYPIVENLRQLNTKDIHLQFRELSLKYGPIFTVFLPVPVVVITNYEGVKEETKGESLTARPPIPHNEDFSFGINAGIFNANGESWMENRRLAISILRDFGMGRSLMEEKIKFAISEYLELIYIECNTDNVDLRWSIQTEINALMVANIIIETLFGFRYSYSESQPIVDFMNAFSSLAEMALSNQLIRFSPYTLPIPMMQRVSRKVHGPKFNLMKSFIESNTEKALKSLNENLEDRCFVHSYARKIGSRPNITSEAAIIRSLSGSLRGWSRDDDDNVEMGLARAELFLIIAATIQHYHLLPTNDSLVDIEPKSTVNMMPNQQNLKLVPVRNW